MHSVVATAVVFAAMAASSGVARADKVVLAPLSSLGEETKSKPMRAIQRKISTGLRSVRGFSLVSQKDMLAKVKTANRNDLRNCEGGARCLSQLGALLGARYVVYGEVGGVGKIQIAYLKLVDVRNKRELRTTTLELSKAADKGAPRAAAVRLLAPKQYVGSLSLDVDVDGASVFVDGRLATKSPAKPMSLAVGTHAIRVTHPEYRDFVRFIDVTFSSTETLAVGLQQYPIVSSDMRRMAGADLSGSGRPIDEPTPWYRRWYTIAGAGAVVFIGSALIIGALSDGVDAEAEKTVE